jgi:hypothetical protein
VICEVKVVNAEELMEFYDGKRSRMFWWGEVLEQQG